MSGILAQLGTCEEVQTTPAMSSIAPSTQANGMPVFTITFASAHGLLAQDTITIAGATPSTYNGTWTVLSVPTATTAVVTTPTQLAANTVVGTYVAGIYARGGTPDRFFDMLPGEGLKGTFGRIESQSLRPNSRVQSNDRWAINKTGANGPVSFEVMSRQFGRWLKHMFGAIATTGPTDSAYTHTATIASMRGLSQLIQVGKPFTGSQVGQPFTYPGVKILDWTLSNDVDGILTLALTLDGQDEQITVALATASYPAAGQAELLTYAGGQVSVGGVQVDVKSFSLKCDMGYNADRRFIRSNTLQREPVEAQMRNFTFSIDAEWTDLTQYLRFASAKASGAMAALSASWVAPTLIGSTTFPSLTISGPNARFDGDSPVVANADLLDLPLSGRLLKTPSGSTNDACSAAYVTLDSTP